MAADSSSAANAWVDSYLDALLSFGLSSEYLQSTKEAQAKETVPDADRSLYSRYYVQSLLNLDEQALHSAWSKASSATRQGGEKDARLQYLSWRIWHMRRRHAQVQLDRRAAAEDGASVVTEPTSASYSSEEEGEYDEYFKPYGRFKSAEARERERGRAPAGGGDASPPRAAAGAAAEPKAAEPKAAEPKAEPRSRQGLQVKIGGTDALETVFEDFGGTPSEQQTPRAPLEHRFDRLYVILISLHGLVRGDRMELGRDSDTGGQVKYVVELAKALALHPSVYRVDLLTRLIQDPAVDPSYGQPEECLVKGRGELGGAYIVRLPCGPPETYVRKELLWPYVREFADRGIAHATNMLAAMADAGRRCELYVVHGHYADAGEVAVLMSSTLDVHMVMTGHSLGRNKLEHLLASGAMTRAEIEQAYAISRRIEAEERCLDNAVMVFTSTRQEVDEQWGLYDGYSPQLSRVLRFHRSYGRHMPNMKVIPPGLDFSALKVSMPEDPTLREFEQARALQDMLEKPQPLSPAGGGATAAAASGAASPRLPGAAEPAEAAGPSGGQPAGGGGGASAPATPSITSGGGAQSPRGGSSSGAEAPVSPRPGVGPAELVLDPAAGPPIWKEITRFLRNPLKPAILAMSRPDPKKNITTLVEAFGKHSMLRELANLVLIMGNRDNIDGMASGTQKVLTQVLKLVDAHDLYGSVAYPKHHTQKDISDIYLFAYATRGVFVNIALQEPFGLTVIEAAAHGVPTVATKNGGPVDIMATLHHGVVVDPTDADAVAAALLRILTAPSTWDDMSTSGVKNIMAYSWPSHCKKYLESIEVEKRTIKSTKKHDRTLSGLLGKRPGGVAGLGLTESAKERHDAAALGVVHGADSLSRYFSTPVPALKEAEVAAQAVGAGLGSGPRKTISGVSNDDLAILSSLDTEALLKQGELPRGERRRRLVAVALDSDFALPQVTAAVGELLRQLEAAGLRDDVGVGMLSMLGFESTCSCMQAAGIDRREFDFMVCNSGADVWHQYGDGRWDADEQYEGQIGFEWDRVALHRMLNKIISTPQENNRRLPRLKELLYNVQEQPAAGVHPRHICLELDPESQAILAAGMGPRSRPGAQPSAARSLAVVERLKRRLRSKGMRASYNLQMVPRDAEWLSVLHITPLRASRPLALRYLAQRLGLPLDGVTVLALAPEAAGSAAAGSLVAGSYCSDTQDLVGGMQQVCIALPGGDGDGAAADAADAAITRSPPLPAAGQLADALGVAMQPFLQGSSAARVALTSAAAAPAAVVEQLQKQWQ